MSKWKVVTLEEFRYWYDGQDDGSKEEVAGYLRTLQQYGPSLGRPFVDTLKGSTLPNLKELRFEYKRAPIRILFAFDPKQQCVVILGGDKSKDKRWYKINIPKAEKLYRKHLETLERERE